MQQLDRQQIIDMLAHLADKDDGRAVLRALAAPFPADAVSWRLGATTADKSKGMALAYIDSRDEQDRLDDVMGADWQCEYGAMPDGSYCCRIGLRIDGDWRWRSDGAVMLSESAKVDAKEMANKGSYSDAFKRAAVKWGVGRYLYTLDSPWVDCKPTKDGKSAVMVDGAQNKLRAHLAKWLRARGYNSDGQMLASGPQTRAPAEPAKPLPPQPAQPPKATSASESAAATAKTDGAIPPPAALPADGQTTAETLLAGIPHHEGLRDIVRRINTAAKAVTAGKQGESVETLDAAYKDWQRWMGATMPQLSATEQSKVFAAMEHYGKAANKLDAAVKAATAKAMPAHDPETGEIMEYEQAEAAS